MNDTIIAYLRQLEFGQERRYENLAMFPLVAQSEAKADYLTLVEALAGGTARMTEVSESGSVPGLLFDNASPRCVLLLDGDELVGARQNRVVNITMLVGAGQKLVIPVSCVDHGRWSYRSRNFQSEDRMLFAEARAA